MDETIHDYTSTACLHGEHDKCRLVCKFCPTKCQCACHITSNVYQVKKRVA